MSGALFALTFSMPIGINTSAFVWIAVAVFVFFLVSRFAGPKKAADLVAIASRSTDLLRFIDQLGAPALAPLLKAIADKKWNELPGQFMTLLNTLQDKVPRKQFLDGIMYTQIDNRLQNADEREQLLKHVETALGITIPRPSA